MEQDRFSFSSLLRCKIAILDFSYNADGDEEEDEERDKKAEQDTVQP